MKQCQLCPPMTDVGRCATIVSSTSSSELAFLIGPGAINIIHNIISDYYYYKILHHLWNQTFNSSCFISPLSSHVSHNFSVIILERVYGKNTKYDIHYTQSLLHNHIQSPSIIHTQTCTDRWSIETHHSFILQTARHLQQRSVSKEEGHGLRYRSWSSNPFRKSIFPP